MKKITHHYFAYGSNMNLMQMKQRCTSAKVFGIARLPGYRVDFYGYSAIWDGAQETVVPDKKSEVWGVLYDLKFFDFEQLDAHVDARFDGTGPYFHYPVDVIDMQKETIDAMIYKKDKCGEEMSPSMEYLNFIIQGAKEQGLPAEYVAILQNKLTRPASYAVPIIKKTKFSWTSATCGDCGQ
jgi:hypothetical protein